jgi:cytochrome c-type biogenesis protein
MSSLPLPLAAFLGGLMSFVSPCVLPLVPGYISAISGTSFQEVSQRSGRSMHSLMLNSFIFILGFSLVFVSLGVLAIGLGQSIGRHLTLFNRVAGLIIIVLGLHQTGLVPIRFLYSDRRFHRINGSGRASASFLIGFSFGFGWTPCVGPILTTILGLAASEATLVEGVILLSVYSLGLAVPFFLTSFGIERFLKFYARFRPYTHAVELAGGTLLIIAGALVFTRQFSLINSWLNQLPMIQSFEERFL